MPRLRYYKNYSPVEEEDKNERRFSGESWLSNNAVIASMPDGKLKEALAHYKVLVSRLEQELWLRARTPRKIDNRSSSRSVNSTNKTAPRKVKRSNKQGINTERLFRGLKLSQKLKQMLTEYLKGATNAKGNIRPQEEASDERGNKGKTA